MQEHAVLEDEDMVPFLCMKLLGKEFLLGNNGIIMATTQQKMNQAVMSMKQ